MNFSWLIYCFIKFHLPKEHLDYQRILRNWKIFLFLTWFFNFSTKKNSGTPFAKFGEIFLPKLNIYLSLKTVFWSSPVTLKDEFIYSERLANFIRIFFNVKTVSTQFCKAVTRCLIVTPSPKPYGESEKRHFFVFSNFLFFFTFARRTKKITFFL